MAASTVGVIAARDVIDDPALAGASGAAITLGVAAGTSLLAWLMVRLGRRPGLALGYGIAAAGALLVVWAIGAAAFAPLLGGLFLVGFANSSSSLSRYTSAELSTPERRAAAIGLVVWALTIGAIAGPILVPLSAAVAKAAGLDELVGPFFIASLASLAGALLLWLRLRPDPDTIAVPEARTLVDDSNISARAGAAEQGSDPMRRILARPPVLTAVVAMVVGQVVMVMIMAMTPLHMRDHGHDFTAVGVVISAHMLGMFALSPISGRIADRFGATATILASFLTLAIAAVLSAAAPPDGGFVLLAALFLLGYGWNLGFVAGSTLLTNGLRASERTRTQGFTDSIVWGSSALASLAGGVVLATVGFEALGVLGALFLILPAWAVLSNRQRLTVVAGSGP